jgi:hypothetical protein
LLLPRIFDSTFCIDELPSQRVATAGSPVLPVILGGAAATGGRPWPSCKPQGTEVDPAARILGMRGARGTVVALATGAIENQEGLKQVS